MGEVWTLWLDVNENVGIRDILIREHGSDTTCSHLWKDLPYLVIGTIEKLSENRPATVESPSGKPSRSHHVRETCRICGEARPRHSGWDCPLRSTKDSCKHCGMDPPDHPHYKCPPQPWILVDGKWIANGRWNGQGPTIGIPPCITILRMEIPVSNVRQVSEPSPLESPVIDGNQIMAPLEVAPTPWEPIHVVEVFNEPADPSLDV